MPNPALTRRLSTAMMIGCCLLVAPSFVRAETEIEVLQGRVKRLEAEVAELRARLEKLDAARTPSPPAPLKITVIPGEWGETVLADIEAVCRSAAQELTRHMSERNQDPITIRHDAQKGPMVIYGKGADGERRVLLSSKGRSWSQFAFQFAHEVCHIQCNYRGKEKSNLWFEESLCETASLFAMRQMAETWKTKPPYANWKSYAGSLREYADQRLTDIEKPSDTTLAEWYRQNEMELRSSGVNRKKNQVVAAALLPLLEKNPQHWQAIRFLNLGDPQEVLSFSQFLRDWHRRVPPAQQPFVEEVAGLFEIAVK